MDTETPHGAAERDEELTHAPAAHAQVSAPGWRRIGPGSKKARRRGVTIVFYDEFDYSFLERLWRTWAPLGQRSILRRFMPGGFVLICDRASIHTSQTTVRYFFEHPEIIVEPLPKYAPELNPEEYCHGNVKRRLANVTPDDRQQMRRFLNRGFARLRRRPELLLSFVQGPGLPVNQLWLT